MTTEAEELELLRYSWICACLAELEVSVVRVFEATGQLN